MKTFRILMLSLLALNLWFSLFGGGYFESLVPPDYEGDPWTYLNGTRTEGMFMLLSVASGAIWVQWPILFIAAELAHRAGRKAGARSKMIDDKRVPKCENPDNGTAQRRKW